MKYRRVLLDASVLYTEPVRGLLLWIAALGGFFYPLWTARILDEVGIAAEKIPRRPPPSSVSSRI